MQIYMRKSKLGKRMGSREEEQIMGEKDEMGCDTCGILLYCLLIVCLCYVF